MTFLILFISLIFINFTEVPKELPNTTIFKTSTAIAVTVYHIAHPEITKQNPLSVVIPCWSAGTRNPLKNYVDCSTCERLDGWKKDGPLGDCIPIGGGGGNEPTPVIGG